MGRATQEHGIVTGDERARMRDLLRSAVSQSRLPGAELKHPGIFVRPSVPDDDLVDRFTRELTTLGGNVHHATNAGDVAAILKTLVADQTDPKVLMWDERHLPVPGLVTALKQAGLILLTQDPALARSHDHRQLLSSASIGLTGADAALAQTGSLVLASGPGRGRLASLLTPVHVALLRRTTLIGSLPELIAARPELVTQGANFVCITGPSRTADIEHVLARGVHGPREIHAVFVD
jgi:L-lactate dehydrogenase complex protein LldG